MSDELLELTKLMENNIGSQRDYFVRFRIKNTNEIFRTDQDEYTENYHQSLREEDRHP